MSTSFRPSFLTEIQLEYGPVDLISRFLRYADALNREQDIVLSLATLEELQEVKRTEQGKLEATLSGIQPEGEYRVAR